MVFTGKLTIAAVLFLFACFAIAPLIHATNIPSFGYLYWATYLGFSVYALTSIRMPETAGPRKFRLMLVARIVYLAVMLFLGYVVAMNSGMLFGVPH